MQNPKQEPNDKAKKALMTADPEEKTEQLRQAADSGQKQACYEYALLLEKRDPEASLYYLRSAAQQLHAKSLRRLIQTLKKSSVRTVRYQADQWMLQAHGAGLNGYEYPVAHMLFEGLGYYSRLPLEHTNRRRALQIILYEAPSQRRSLTLGRFLLEAKVPFRFHKKADALSYSPATALPSTEIPYSPAEALQWLHRSDCAEGYALIALFYREEGNREQALAYYEKARASVITKRLPQKLRYLEQEMREELHRQTPEERLSFLFDSDDPVHRLSVLKKALWAVTSEGYCRVMRQTLESGAYDPEAEEWNLLFARKQDIQELYDKYLALCEDKK